ncbi:NADH dehydrogenase [ubiquinone] 1 alpha subcomplex subunit 12 [Intoshia linei]|uniref:NADH dehydrogenase [ubiquinone] 1 alpha subcomplex subunit 12 n=1 Tax=Intoshia linei TaxID=1819745 RepID=A0A177B2H8_9BILA|nr:NADH dehydrogenase [ubiquinone] 1 alpha subcomplex subunit 12 [Intoshia linei]
MLLNRKRKDSKNKSDANFELTESLHNVISLFDMDNGLNLMDLFLRKSSYKNDTLKHGKCVGEDQFGNKYFYNPNYFVGRSRWIEYSNKTGWDYNASEIPPMWHAWIHYQTDSIPNTKEILKNRKPWMTEHTENKTGTIDNFLPYITSKDKIQEWKEIKK